MIKNGYQYIKKPAHPNSNKNGWIKRSRYNLSWKIGRPLRDNEECHHINGDKLDDRYDNLELIQHDSHSRLHLSKRRPRKIGVCYCARPWSIKTYSEPRDLRKLFRYLRSN